MEPAPRTYSDGARHASPPLVLLGVAHASVFLASLAVTGFLANGGHFPSPFAPAAASLDFFSRYPIAVRWSAFLQLGAAVPLGLFTATVASRLRFLGVRAAGVSIAFFGGVAASVFLALSAIVQWTLASPEVVQSAPTVRALHLVAFAAGGPAHVVALGLLLAGVAVTAGLHRLVPKWLMASGLVLAIVAELSWLSLVLPAASYLLPLARVPAFAWLILVGAILPDRRKGAAESSGLRGAPSAAPGLPRGFAKDAP